MGTKEVSVSKKLTRLGNDVQIQDIGNQLSQYLYEKPLTTIKTGILGQAQVIRSAQEISRI
jgi:hypothetical protein